MATAAYQASPETTDSQISYALEATWGVLPSVQFQAIRYTSDSLSDAKTRQRPSEINNSGEVSAAVTTKDMASGDINTAFSYATFDDFIAGAINSVWQARILIVGVSGDIVLTNNSATQATLSSATTNKFATITTVGQWVRLVGFTNAANNGYFRVKTITDTTHIVLTTLVNTTTETPAGAAASIRGSTISNGVTFQSFYMQKMFSSALFLEYPGTYCTGMSISGGVGQFLTCKFSFIAQQEMSATGNASTGAVLAAPTNPVYDPVVAFMGVYLNESSIGTIVDSFTINIQEQGADTQFAMSSSLAQGIIRGELQVDGTIKIFFKDFSLYAKFKAETHGALEFIMASGAGGGAVYVITIPNATLMNPKIVAGGPGQSVYAEFTIEGNPQSGGGTIQFDRMN